MDPRHGHTGALRGRRTKDVDFASGSPNDTHDLLAVFEYDSQDHGLISREKYYGGDPHPLATSSGFTTSGGPDYELDHAYLFLGGALPKGQSSYAGRGFLNEDADHHAAT